MRLYKTSGEKADHEVKTSWAGTQADAAKARKEAKAVGLLFIETEEVDVPTDKAGLLKWLNENNVS